MAEAGENLGAAARKLNKMLTEALLPELPAETAAQFEAYLHVLLRWNSRTNLTAVRDEDGILRRHFLECIACARALPFEVRTLLDFGSGAGFPGLPIALCRPEIEVTLAESQGKKAAFLREVVRTLGLSVAVHGGRADTVGRRFGCVALRAVDRTETAIGAAAGLVEEGGWLAVLTTEAAAARVREAAGAEFQWGNAIALPGGEQRILALGRRK